LANAIRLVDQNGFQTALEQWPGLLRVDHLVAKHQHVAGGRLREAESLEDTAGYVGRSFTLLADGEAVRVRGGSITPNLFQVLGLEPALGRGFAEEEGRDIGFEASVILSHRLWQRRYGGDPDLLQHPARINGRALTVVGIMPEGIRFPERDELWVPYRPGEPRRGQNRVAAFGLLRPDADPSRVQGELDLIASRLAREFPDSYRGWGFAVLPFRDLVVDPGTRATMAALMGAVDPMTALRVE
jgi:putative ABC transport system permease protein